MTSTVRGTTVGSDSLTQVSDVLEGETSLGSLIPGLWTVRTVTLLSISLFCAVLAWLGGATLFYLLLSKYFSPAAAHYSRNLYFDYTKPDAVATAHFLPDVQYSRALTSPEAAAQARFLSSKQAFDIWLELATPESHGQQGDEVFQVLGELLTGDGRIAGTASRPCLVRQRYWVSRTLRLWLNAPFVILGLWDERQDVSIPLFQNHREQASLPFVVFRATLQARAGGGRLPQLYEAKVHLRLRLGMLARLFYLTRLGSWLTWLSVAAALLSLTGGAFGCVTFFALWWATRSSSPAPVKGTYGIPQDDFPAEEDESDDELASQGDIDGVYSEFAEGTQAHDGPQKRKTAGTQLGDNHSHKSYDSREPGFSAASTDSSGGLHRQQVKKIA